MLFALFSCEHLKTRQNIWPANYIKTVVFIVFCLVRLSRPTFIFLVVVRKVLLPGTKVPDLLSSKLDLFLCDLSYVAQGGWSIDIYFFALEAKNIYQSTGRKLGRGY